jgi:hypothetical protein
MRRAWGGRRRWSMRGGRRTYRLGLEESSDGRQDSEKEDEEEEGHVEGAGLDDEGVRVTGLL